jgi:hypothetical protein
MGIDIGYWNAEEEDLEEVERLTGVPGFFAAAETLSGLLRLMDEHGLARDMGAAEIRTYWEAFERYVGGDPERHETRFAQYCAFVGQMGEALEREHGPVVDVMTGRGPMRPQAGEFAPEVRVFLARTLLDPAPVGPSEAETMYGALVYMGIVLKKFRDHWGGTDPALEERLAAIQAIVATVAGFCETCMNENRPFAVSA